MLYFLAFIVNFVQLLIGFFQLILFIYAIFSWIPSLNDDNPLVRIVYFIAEPLLYPARLFLSRFDTLASFPIDISFVVTYLALIIIGEILPAVAI